MIDISQFLIEGKSLENKIIKNLKNALGTSRKEDINGVDFKISYTFDVKGAKKVRRSGQVDYSKTWLEYKNVNEKPGSLQKADLDYFIFEREFTWEVRSRVKALDFFLSKCRYSDGKAKPLLDLNKFTEVELYQPYRRNGRLDVIMLVEFDTSDWTADLIIPKDVIQ